MRTLEELPIGVYDALRTEPLFSVALAESGPLDFPLEKFFLIFFAHEKGLGHIFQKCFFASPQAKNDFWPHH